LNLTTTGPKGSKAVVWLGFLRTSSKQSDFEEGSRGYYEKVFRAVSFFAGVSGVLCRLFQSALKVDRHRQCQ
jgi:hypothetical protein